MQRDRAASDPPGMSGACDLGAVLDGLAPELEALMDGEVRFLKDLPAGPVPVGLPEEELEQIVLGLVGRLRRCVEEGGWMLAAVERVTLGDAEAGPLGLRAGEHAVLRIAARFEQLPSPSPLTRLAAAAVDSMGGLGGRALRALAAYHAGAVQIGAVPGAGITATLFLRAPTGSGRQWGGDGGAELTPGSAADRYVTQPKSR